MIDLAPNLDTKLKQTFTQLMVLLLPASQAITQYILSNFTYLENADSVIDENELAACL